MAQGLVLPEMCCSLDWLAVAPWLRRIFHEGMRGVGLVRRERALESGGRAGPVDTGQGVRATWAWDTHMEYGTQAHREH